MTLHSNNAQEDWGPVSFPSRTVVGVDCSDDVLGSLPCGTHFTTAVDITLPAVSTQKQE